MLLISIICMRVRTSARTLTDRHRRNYKHNQVKKNGMKRAKVYSIWYKTIIVLNIFSLCSSSQLCGVYSIPYTRIYSLATIHLPGNQQLQTFGIASFSFVCILRETEGHKETLSQKKTITKIEEAKAKVCVYFESLHVRVRVQ